jgi:diacylglycerol kinase family enzyme/membrane-associated phospholipid phosphatase
VTTTSAQRRFLVVAGVLGALFVLLLELVSTRYPPLMSFDARVVSAWHGAVRGTAWHGVLTVVAVVTHPWVVRVLLLGFAAGYALHQRRRTAIWILAVLLVNGVAWGTLKQVVARPRPDFLHQVAGWSFPSGHAAEISGGMGVLVVLTLAGVRRTRPRRALLVLEIAVVILVGCDRVLLGAHYPSDVVGGWLLGATVVLASLAVFGVPQVRWAVASTRPLAPLPERRQRLAVVLNPIKVADVHTFKARVGRAAREAGWDEPLWFETTVDDAGSAMALAAVAAGADVVAVAGGDGTVRVVCGEMAGSGIPVGVIPAGTGNLLARNLGIPLVPEQAVETVLRGRDRAIDIARLEGDGIPATRFVVMAGLGLDAAIMGGAPDALKRRLGWPAYVVAGARHLRYPAVRVDITVDDAEPVRRRARTVVIGNVGLLQAGIPLLPDARIDDGVLDVVVIAPRRLVGWVSLVWRVVTKHPGTDERLDRYTGRSVVVQAAHATPRQLDGDTVGAGTELRASIEAGRLLVRVPR